MNQNWFMFFALIGVMSLQGCYSRQAFARRAQEISAPILEDYKEYLNQDPRLSEERKGDRLGTVKDFEDFLEKGTKGR